MALSVGVKAALIGAGSGLLSTLVAVVVQYQIAKMNDQSKADTKLLRNMVVEYAKCGCKISIPPVEAKNNSDYISVAKKLTPAQFTKYKIEQTINDPRIHVVPLEYRGTRPASMTFDFQLQYLESEAAVHK